MVRVGEGGDDGSDVTDDDGCGEAVVVAVVMR